MGVRASGFAVCSQPIDGAGRNTWIVCMPPMDRPCFCCLECLGSIVCQVSILRFQVWMSWLCYWTASAGTHWLSLYDSDGWMVRSLHGLWSLSVVFLDVVRGWWATVWWNTWVSDILWKFHSHWRGNLPWINSTDESPVLRGDLQTHHWMWLLCYECLDLLDLFLL